MADDRGGKHAPARIVPAHHDVIEPLVGGRMRVLPAAVPDIAAYLLTLRARHERAAKLTLRGLTGKARKIAQGKIAHAQCMVAAYDEMIRSMGETIDMEEFALQQLAFKEALLAVEREAASWQ